MSPLIKRCHDRLHVLSLMIPHSQGRERVKLEWEQRDLLRFVTRVPRMLSL